MSQTYPFDKTQGIRLLDVFVLGPWLFYLGARSGTGIGDLERLALIAAGGLTVLYNGKNYLDNERAKLEEPEAVRELVVV